jgi:hypothetical protein
LPKEGAILAANHGEAAPFDATMIVCDQTSRPPRLVRTVVDWAGTLPFVNVFYARVGQVSARARQRARALAP